MASFVGTNKEFRRYIGPRLRNLVQQFTKNHKVEISVCEHCGSSENLESAHVHNRDRNKIIDVILNEHTYNNVATVDIDLFEKRFKEEHYPLEQSILILCRNCHKKYDSIAELSNAKPPEIFPKASQLLSEKRAEESTKTSSSRGLEYGEVQKVRRKVPRWFRHSQQINSRILVTFLNLKNNNIYVTPTILQESCRGIDDFSGNYNQMKNFGEKNHAKVFEEIGNEIKLWDPVKDFIMEEYWSHKNSK